MLPLKGSNYDTKCMLRAVCILGILDRGKCIALTFDKQSCIIYTHYAGGLYVSTERDGKKSSRWETPYMVIVNSSFTDNTAWATGGAIFTYEADAVDVCGIPQVHEVTERIYDLRSEVKGVPRLENASLADANTSCLQTWIGNKAVDEHGGNVTAGIATYVRACNDSTSCSNDNSIVISNHTSGTELSPFSIELFDAFGYIAFGQPKMEIQIEDFSDAILPNQVIPRIEAMTNITGIRLMGKVGKEYNLTLSFRPQILDDLNLLVRVRECLPGEVPDDKQEQCLSCAKEFYSFNPKEKCAECPPHAKCSPSTITPEPNYWHFKSDSINIQRCASQRACSYEGREHILEQQAWSMHHVNMTLDYTDNSSYRQCRKVGSRHTIGTVNKETCHCILKIS